MAIHTLSIGGTSYVIEPKYASSAGYAATAGRASYSSSAGYATTASNAKYASSATYASNANTASYAVTASRSSYAVTANHAVTAGNAKYASSATYATTAGYAGTAGMALGAAHASDVLVRGNNTATNYPVLLAGSVATTAGAVKSLYTDTVNSLHYNPSTNLLTVPSFITSALGVSGGVTIYNGSNFNLRASAAAATDPGDIVFSNSSNTELGRLWLDQGSVFKLRYGSSDAAKTIIHEGNIDDYLTTQSMKTLKIATSVAAGGNTTYASYNGSSDVTIDWVANAGYASSATYAGGAGIAHYASSAAYATTADHAVTASRASFAAWAGTANFAVTAHRAAYAATADNATVAYNAYYASSATYATTAAHAITAGMSKTTWSNPSTSTFYIVGSTTAASGSNTLIKNASVKVESNSVRASGGFYETSDARLKTITNDVEVDFERLKSIPKIQYIKKGETAPHIGTIAQDLQKVYPEFVEAGDDGYLVVDYAKLSVIPLKAVDILYDEVSKLKKENQMLKERLDSIEAIINK